MEAIVQLVLAAFELVEAEGRVLRDQLFRIVMAMALGVIIIVLTLTGLGFLLYSLFSALSRPLSPAGAAAVFGVGSLLLAFGGGAVIRSLLSSGGNNHGSGPKQ